MEKFHKNIADQIEKKKTNKVIEKLNQLREIVLNSPINVHFACDISKISITPEKNAELWNFIKPNKHAIFDVFIFLLTYCLIINNFSVHLDMDQHGITLV